MADLGKDISTFVDGDLDPAFVVITGSRVVGEAIARRLTTPAGSLIDAPDTWDVRQLLEADLDETDLAAARAIITLQAEADERVRVASDVRAELLNEVLRVSIGLVTDEGPFSLTLDVSKLGVAQLLTTS